MSHAAHRLHCPEQSVSVRAFKSFGGAAPAVFSLEGAAPGSGSLTCILGPNGSGKSALLEALCFALGAPPSTMRARVLRDVVSTESDSQVSARIRQCGVQRGRQAGGPSRLPGAARRCHACAHGRTPS